MFCCELGFICDVCGIEVWTFGMKCEHCNRRTCRAHYDMGDHPLLVTVFDMRGGPYEAWLTPGT